MNIAMILAGGVGSRMGFDIPKQFIEVLGKPIIIYTLERFEQHPDIDAIQIVCLESYIEYIKSLVIKYGIKKVRWIVPGGSTFSNSVCNGVFDLKSKCMDNDIAIIHMSVSPFVSNDIIADSISVCNKHGNAISANPSLLCMGIKSSENYSDEGVLRETLIGLNTPQSFKFGEIYDVYKKAVDENLLNKIEPHTTSLMYEYGKRLYFSKGSQYNIKITTSKDLDLFEGYVLLKQKRNIKW